MVRNYKRKTVQNKVPTHTLMKGIADVINCNRSVRSVADEIKMHPMTLWRYIKKSKALGLSPENVESFSQRKFIPVFSRDQESMLKSYLKTAANIYFGLSPSEVRVLAFECADAFKLKMPDSWVQNKAAGPDWFSGFMKRHPDLSIRSPEAMSLSRATSFNKENVALFFNKLSIVMERENFNPSDIWNLDESGVTTVQKPRSVVATKGVKQIGCVTSAERGELVTLCFAISANGNSVPPMFIFPRVKFQDHFIRDGPVGCIGSAYISGWMTSDNFMIFMKHFVKTTKASKDKKVLLLLDNHESHVHIDVINYARENGVIMLSFPPHCSHKLQPLDRSVFGPFKRYLASAQSAWLRNNPGKRMSIYDIPSIVKDCLPKAATPINIMHGFKATGIYPFNNEIFTAEEFLTSYVTDRPLPDNIKLSDSNEAVITENVTVSNDCQQNDVHFHSEDVNTVPIDEWGPINAYATELGRSLIHVSGDGHCILHAFRRSLQEENITSLSHDELCFRLKNEIIVNKSYYEAFAGERDIVADVEHYIENKDYNNDTGDLVLAALCNAIGVSAILYQYLHNGIHIAAHAPGRPGVLCKGYVHLVKNGHDGNSHYNCFGKCSVNLLNANKEDISFSPEHIRPYPKAPPRKSSAGRRKRKTAILTDTPEKKALEEQQLRNGKSKSAKKALTKERKPKKRAKHTKKSHEIESSGEEEWYCLICLEPYSNSKAREKWIQCVQCKEWAHEECTSVLKGQIFVCQNCDSDADDDVFYG